MFNSLQAKDVEPGMNIILGKIAYQVASKEVNDSIVIFNLIFKNRLKLQLKTLYTDDITVGY